MSACAASALPAKTTPSASITPPIAPSNSSITYGIVPPQLPSQKVLNQSIAAMTFLADGKPFIVHLYMTWSNYKKEHSVLAHDIAAYSAHNMQIDLALQYVPSSANSSPSKFANFVAQVVTGYSRQPALTRIQVTNEPNSPLNAGTFNGSYSQAMQALVLGIEAGYNAKIKSHSDVKLGFNWFYSFGPSADQKWWSELGALGGSKFANDVSWVGVDDYPGTWVPHTLAGTGSALYTAGYNSVVTALYTVRTEFMPLAKLTPQVQLGLSEIGWSTNPPTRSYADQALLLQAFAKGACSVSTKDNLSFLQWFELAGKDRNGLSMGLLHSNFKPKPAFKLYKSIIQEGCTKKS
ncbi:MAG: hypothetical protein M1152_05610 [Actinobacteria bacterium]|nr:hypothetical protein [Actinomycetota bacterium]